MGKKEKLSEGKWLPAVFREVDVSAFWRDGQRRERAASVPHTTSPPKNKYGRGAGRESFGIHELQIRSTSLAFQTAYLKIGTWQTGRFMRTPAAHTTYFADEEASPVEGNPGLLAHTPY